MVRWLKHMMQDKMLRELGLFNPEQRSLKGKFNCCICLSAKVVIICKSNTCPIVREDTDFFSKVYRERSRGNSHKLQNEKFQQDKIMFKKCCRGVKHCGMRPERWQILHYQKIAKIIWARLWGISFISVVLLWAGWISWLQKSFIPSCFVVLFWVAQSLLESLPLKFWGKRSDSFYHQIVNRFWKSWFCLELLDQQKTNKLMHNVRLLCPVC